MGDDLVFASGILPGVSPLAAAFVSEVDADGGVAGIEITNPGRYLVTPSATVQSEAGADCVLLPDL
ncbi:MAG: hypothetical protein MK291_13580, partial [Planctomycetes bacterium]|nr:hypothetical protein [Planctomycetota bacterium]